MTDTRLIRMKITEVRNLLTEIEKLICFQEDSLTMKEIFYKNSPFEKGDTAEDFFKSMEVATVTRNVVTTMFAAEHNSRGTAIRDYSAFYAYTWLRGVHPGELSLYRNFGRKGAAQLLDYVKSMDERLKLAQA